MNAEPQSYRDVVNLWPDAEELATDLGELGVTVRQWRNRNSIPPALWRRVIEAGERRGFVITMEQLQTMAEHKRSDPEARAS